MTTAQTIDGSAGLRVRSVARAVALALGYVAAAALGCAGLLRDGAVRPEHAISWLVISAAVLCADLIVVDFALGSQSLRLDMSAVPLAVGAVFTDERGLIVAVVAATAASALLRRRLDGVVAEMGSRVIAVCVLEAVVWSMLGGRLPRPGADLVAVAVGAVAYELWGAAGWLVGSMATRRQRPASNPAWVAAQIALMVAYNALLSALAVLIGLQQIWGLLLLAAPAAFLGLWYRSVRVIHRRYEGMQQLYGFTAQLADLPDTEAIVAAALALCQQLLLCRHAHLVLQGADRAMRWEIADGESGAIATHSSAATAESLTPMDLDLLGVDGPVLVPRKPRHGEDARRYENLMAAPVSVGESGAGVLVVANRRVSGGTFDRDDLRLFEALSNHLAAALTSTRRLEQLRTAVAAREHQALHDGLTGLGNRTLFTEWVSRQMDRCSDGTHAGVLVVGLDGFKDINDTLGHHYGDLVLQEIAARLERLTDGDGFAARLGGDEFAVLLCRLGGTEDATVSAAGLAAAISAPVSVGDMPLEVRASIGIAVAPAHGTDPATLLQRADVAMYSAKAAKRPWSVYDADMERDTRRRLTLGSSLRQAFESGRIEVWYQPVARSATGWTSGCEALLRWRDDDGFIPPSEFIPIAEHTGLIEPLTWWTLETALGDLQSWRAEDLCPSVAVNLSARCLQAPDVISRIRDLLISSDNPPSALMLEITESLLMSDPLLAEELLNQLGLMGVRVAIDDFGTGYSSLSRLKRLPVDTIKIDREFVTNMHSDRDDEAIVKATLELARTLGCAVVAEGVETFETWHRLQSLGCQQIQGYILAEPMPAHECRQWLRNRRNLLGRPSAR